MPRNPIPSDATIKAVRSGDPRKRLSDGAVPRGTILPVSASTPESSGTVTTAPESLFHGSSCGGMRMPTDSIRSVPMPKA